jgi:hypothetical protein
MKRLLGIIGALLAASSPFQKEKGMAECNDAACAIEPAIIMPEQPHSSEKLPTYEVPDGMVEIPSSPANLVGRGSDLHLRWLAENGYDVDNGSLPPREGQAAGLV